MRVQSCLSCNLDPYKAGVEIAEALAHMQPEVIFLFSSIHYQGSPELLEALYAELSPCKPLLIGCTGYGVYALDSVAEIGVSALALNSEGRVRWHLAQVEGLEKQPYQSTRHCLSTLLSKCERKPSFLFLTSDFHTDSTEVLRALNEGTDVPVIGSLAGDDYQFEHCFVYVNEQVRTDTLALLCAEGDIRFALHLGNSPEPVGNPGRITESEGTLVRSVEGIPAMSFVEREVGKPLDHLDKGVLTMRTVNPDYAGEHQVRSMFMPSDSDAEQGVKLFGGVDKGESIQVCAYPARTMLRDVERIASLAEQSGFKAEAALVISCAGRKAVLGQAISQECSLLRKHNPSLQGLTGIPSYGEFAPVPRIPGYSPTRFHNMTYTLLLLASP